MADMRLIWSGNAERVLQACYTIFRLLKGLDTL
jgi:hypothetical protein